MEVDWTMLSLVVIGLFAMSGFFKGWWKEAIATAFLIVLVFLLGNSAIAQMAIDGLNKITATVWKFIPESGLAALNLSQVPPQADASSPSIWVVILILCLTLATLIGRSTLRNYGHGGGYEVRPMGSLLGAVLGGFNGFVAMGLLKAYLDKSGLPASSVATLGSAANVPSGVAITAMDVPAFSITDSFLPWVIILLGGLVLVMAVKNRVGYIKSKDGYRKIQIKEPYGHRKY